MSGPVLLTSGGVAEASRDTEALKVNSGVQMRSMSRVGSL